MNIYLNITKLRVLEDALTNEINDLNKLFGLDKPNGINNNSSPITNNSSPIRNNSSPRTNNSSYE